MIAAIGLVAGWAVVAACLSTFVVFTAFLILPSAKRIRAARAAGEWVPRAAVVIAYIWLVIGVPADAVYNWIVGSFRHRKSFLRLALPKKLYEMYSARIQQLVLLPLSERPTKALKWASFMNIVDSQPRPHIRMPEDA